MRVTFDCPEHGWEDYDVGATGFLVLVKSSAEDSEFKVVGLTPLDYVEVHWSSDGHLHGVTFGHPPEQAQASENGKGEEVPDGTGSPETDAPEGGH